MDLNMPVMGGFEATRKIRNYQRENELLSLEISAKPYIIALSASDIDQNLVI
jgi:CheY-like chemotaxis protein